jgi:hypothetical protein
LDGSNLSGTDNISMPDTTAYQILLATSQDAIKFKKRGSDMCVDDVAGNVRQALPSTPLSQAVAAQVEFESRS